MYRAIEVFVRRSTLRGRAAVFVSGLVTLLVVLAIPAGSAKAALAPTPVPYMGWNTYYGVGGVFDESTIKSVAESLISSGLAQAGYRIVWLDFGWGTGARDSSGNLIVDSTQWPDGMSGLTAWLHAQGLMAGIYTDAGTSGCSGQGVGSYGHYQQDVDQFAAWGFDAIKLDFCGAGQEWLDQPPNDPRTLYREFSQAVAVAPRAMILNVCNFWTPGQINGTAPSYADSSWDTFSWAPAVAQSWRTDTDIGYTGNIQFQWVLRNLDQDSTPYPNIQDAAGPPGSSGIGWGHWNDPDYLGPGLGMTSTQAQSQFSMWAMVAAPLILGSDPRSLSSTSITMLKNSRVIAIDQDSLGAQGWLVSQNSAGQQVWVKPLAGGARAVALFNRGSSPEPITTSASAVGLPTASRYTLVNVWTNQTSTSRGNINAYVQPDAVVLYRVTADPGCTVPQLLGKTLSAARASLKSDRCSLGRVTHGHAKHARRGRVIAQSPRAGSHRRRGAKVKVVVAS
jgi:alpha-galactosidase